MLLFIFVSILCVGSLVGFTNINMRRHEKIVLFLAIIWIITTMIVLFLSLCIFKEILSNEHDLNKDIKTYEYLISLDEEDFSYPYIQYKVKEWNGYILRHQALQHNLWTNWYVHNYYDSFTTISIPGGS